MCGEGDGIFVAFWSMLRHTVEERLGAWALGSAIPLKLSARSAKTNTVSSVLDTRHLTFKLLCFHPSWWTMCLCEGDATEVIYLCNILVSRRWGETLKLVKTHFYLLLQTL